MAYDLELADRIRACLPSLSLREGEVIAEKKMFGGLCITLNGKMLMGVDKEPRYMVRLHTEVFERELAQGRVLPMDFTGRPLRNFAFVPLESCPDEASLLSWLEASAAYVREHMLGSGAGPPRRMRKS